LQFADHLGEAILGSIERAIGPDTIGSIPVKGWDRSVSREGECFQSGLKFMAIDADD